MVDSCKKWFPHPRDETWGGKKDLVSRILGRLFSSFLTATDKFIFLFEMQSETVCRPLKK